MRVVYEVRIRALDGRNVGSWSTTGTFDVDNVLPPLTAEYAIVDLRTGGVIEAAAVADLLTNDDYRTTKLVLKRIAAGSFQMGDEVGTWLPPAEYSPHTVNITQPFYMAVFEVTCRQYYEVIGAWPVDYYCDMPDRDKRPAIEIRPSVLDDLLHGTAAAVGRQIRRPTEAEWEYACKAGTSTNFSYGEFIDGAHHWYFDNSDTGDGRRPQEVGTKLPNPWGLYDMHGNVYEICSDWYDPDYYSYSPTDDPTGPGEQVNSHPKVRRGGNFGDTDSYMLSCYRGAPGCTTGLRPVMEP